MKNVILSVLLPFLLVAQNTGGDYLILGTYTSGKSEGIYVYKFDKTNGAAVEVSHVKTSNPSFVAVSPDKKFVYAVNENGKDGNGGRVSAFSFDSKTGSLTLINDQPSQGDDPCYVSIDKTGKWVFVANYSSGSLSVLPVRADGGLGEVSSHIQDTGSGPDKDRQAKPHVHCTVISPDNHWLYVSDLGIDKIMIYAFDEVTGQLTPAPQPFAAAGPGMGPRHITFHPSGKFAYLMTELSGTVLAYQFKNGALKEFQQISTIPRGQKGFAGGADIHVSPDGKFLYASNRGDFNNIAIYTVSPVDGKLSLVGFQSTLGKAPRNFNFDPSGNYLLAANQDSDEVVVFKRNPRTGLLTDNKNRIAAGKPVCVKWISY